MKYKGEGALPYHRLIIDLDPATHAKLKALAAKHDRAASRQAKVLLMKLLENPKAIEKLLDSK